MDVSDDDVIEILETIERLENRYPEDRDVKRLCDHVYTFAAKEIYQAKIRNLWKYEGSDVFSKTERKVFNKLSKMYGGSKSPRNY